MAQIHEDLKAIGPFEGVVQVVPTVDQHELLSDPSRSLTAGPLTYHGGKLINNSQGKLMNIYLGTMNFDTADFDAFTKAICQNGYYRSPDGADNTPCTFLGSMSLAFPFPSTTVSDSAFAPFLSGLISQGKIHPDGFTNYSIIMPAGTTVLLGSDGSCTSFCGYHTSGGGVYYQIICDSSCGGCHGNFTVNQARMMVQAHEYGEWRSDPDGSGFYNDQTGMENGDECAWNLVPWGPSNQWAVQPLAVSGQCYTGPYTGGPPPPANLQAIISGPTTVAVGAAGQYHLAVTGGTPPYSETWTVDGTASSGSGTEPQFTFHTAGSHTIGVTVRDSGGLTTTASYTVMATGGTPLSVAITGPSTLQAGQAGTWTAAAAGGVTPYSYSWTVDGTATGQAVSLNETFANAGVHTLIVTVTDSTGATVQAKVNVTVTAAPPPPTGCKALADSSLVASASTMLGYYNTTKNAAYYYAYWGIQWAQAQADKVLPNAAGSIEGGTPDTAPQVPKLPE